MPAYPLACWQAGRPTGQPAASRHDYLPTRIRACGQKRRRLQRAITIAGERERGARSVPINALVPVEGTPLGDQVIAEGGQASRPHLEGRCSGAR